MHTRITNNRFTPTRRTRRAAGLAALVGALCTAGVAGAAGSDHAMCGHDFSGGSPGAEISFFAPTFSRYSNPGSGWHDDGTPFMAGFCTGDSG